MRGPHDGADCHQMQRDALHVLTDTPAEHDLSMPCHTVSHQSPHVLNWRALQLQMQWAECVGPTAAPRTQLFRLAQAFFRRLSLLRHATTGAVHAKLAPGAVLTGHHQPTKDQSTRGATLPVISLTRLLIVERPSRTSGSQ